MPSNPFYEPSSLEIPDFDINDYIIITDAHGHSMFIRDTLNRARSEKKKVIFLGDLCDRGLNSIACLRLLLDACKEGIALCIAGNHDRNFYRFLKMTPDKRAKWLKKYGPAKDREYMAFDEYLGLMSHRQRVVYRDMIDYMECCSYDYILGYSEDGYHLFSHASVCRTMLAGHNNEYTHQISGYAVRKNEDLEQEFRLLAGLCGGLTVHLGHIYYEDKKDREYSEGNFTIKYYDQGLGKETTWHNGQIVSASTGGVIDQD